MLTRVCVIILIGFSLAACDPGFFRSQDNDLSALEIERGDSGGALTLDPEFDSNTLSYDVVAASVVDSVNLKATLSDEDNAVMTLNGQKLDSAAWISIDLNPPGQDTIISIIVSSETELQQTYTITVERSVTSSSVATLTQLSLSPINYSPEFSPAVENYSATVSYFVNSAAYSITNSSNEATVNRPSIMNGRVALLAGEENSITTNVTSGDLQSVMNYEVLVTRDAFEDIRRSYVKASNPADNDEFGFAIDTDGTYAAIGAPMKDGGTSNTCSDDETDDNSGAVYVFGLGENESMDPQCLTQNNRSADAQFGASLAIEDNALAVGAPKEESDTGAVYIFERVTATWGGGEKLLVEGEYQLAEGDEFGYSLAISDSYIAVGAPGSSGGEGAVYIYEESETGSAWELLSKITLETAAAEDRFGEVVTFNKHSENKELYIGSPGKEGGRVYVLKQTDDEWEESISEPELVSTNIGDADKFGAAISVEGNRMIVGAPFETGTGNGVVTIPTLSAGGDATGAVYIFNRDSEDDEWIEHEGYLKPPAVNESDEMEFGASVSLMGDMIAVGAPKEKGDANGLSVADTDTEEVDSGAVFLFEDDRFQNNWSYTHRFKADQSSANDLYGSTVLFHDGSLYIGAHKEDGDTSGITDGLSATDINEDSTNSGAVYIYR